MTRPYGIDFQVVPPRPREGLARMDVAAFVGFAASGPVDMPVPVGDPLTFKEIFGPDQPLAWDPGQGQELCGYLGPAVRAFFHNGGRYCWVVRVADRPVTNRFPLPGVMQTIGNSYRGLELQARSPGSWSDALRVGTALQSEMVGQAAFDGNFAATGLLHVTQPARVPIRAGDLLRVQLKDGVLLYFAVTDAAEVTDTLRQKDEPAATQWRVRGQAYWFRTSETAGENQDEVQERKVDVNVRRLEPSGSGRGDINWEGCKGTWVSKPQSLERSWLVVDAPALLAVGDLLQLEDMKSDTKVLLAATEVVTEVEQGTPLRYVSLVKGWTPLTPLAPSERPDVTTPARSERDIECLTLTVWVEDQNGRLDKLTGLGFTPDHPRFLGNLPTDEALFLPADERDPLADAAGARSSLWPDSAYPRFPLAAVPPDEAGGAPVILPIGTDTVIWPANAGVALPQHAPERTRDGLAKFDPELFLDLDLRETLADTLVATAFAKRHLQRQRLRGVHALLPVDEVTLLCLPDLAHTGWPASDGAQSPPHTAPDLMAKPGTPPGQVSLEWNTVADAQSYTVQVATDACFDHGVANHAVNGCQLILPPPVGAGRHVRYFRVRARGADRPGPWSNTLVRQFPPLAFSPTQQLATPTLIDKPLVNNPLTDKPLANKPLGNVHQLTWEGAGEATWVLQTAADPDFGNPTTQYQGTGQRCLVWRTGQSWAYYRVRASRGGEVTPWSNTLALVPVNAAYPDQNQPSRRAKERAAADEPADKPADDRAEILPDQQRRADVHRAVLRLCQARGDLFAILSVPAAYRDNDVITYVRALSTLIGAGEQQALAYGALYHPWLRVETLPGVERLIPPDGPVTGQIAAFSQGQGVWRPPAYKRLAGVTGLHHATPLATYAQMLAEGINMIIQPPDGVVVRSAHSLSLDDNLRPIHVRRLLMLIRRRMLREGIFLVFEPNSEAFRRATVRRLEAVLTDMFVQGAFAGTTPADSFQVRIEPALNGPEAWEQGRLMITLKVAPVQPLVFMTVRVLQEEGREPVFSEV